MIVHFKQSGERLTDSPLEPWTKHSLESAAEEIGALHARAHRLNIEGLLVVSGGGNLMRGANFAKQYPAESRMQSASDVVGRLATVANTVLLAASMRDAKIPTRVFTSDNMGYSDPSLGGRVDPYDIEAVHRAYQREEVVLVAGGMGRDGVTTDAAVMTYALRQAAALPDKGSLAMKATKYNGIYEADPASNPSARRFAELSARWMLQEGLGGLDETCVRLIAEAQGSLALQVYSMEYSVAQALEAEHGTFVLSGEAATVFATQNVT